MLSHRNYLILIAICSLSGTVFAQGSDPSQPYYDPNVPPAWVTPGVPASPGLAPIPGDPNAPGAPGTDLQQQPGSPYYNPVQPSPGFDYFDEEEPYAPSYPSSSRGSKPEGKSSFQIVENPVQKVCRKWGNPILVSKVYEDASSCEYELEEKVTRGLNSIETLYDQVEMYKLKKVIRGDLKDRAEAKKYAVRFDSLKKSLHEASKEGCTCRD